MRFIFTCGGTAGHINPALAVASSLKEKVPSSEILFIGAEGHMEMDLIPREGYEILPIPISSISRARTAEGLWHNLKTAIHVIDSFERSKKIISQFRPDAVIGTGGYVCFPVIAAAHRLGIPTVIHESNAGPGLTTKLLSRIVDRILVGVDGCEAEYPDPSKILFTGTPVREDFSFYTKESARSELGIAQDDFVVLSIWGSLGSEHMNNVITEMIPLLCEHGGEPFRLLHATGERYYDRVLARLDETCPEYRSRKIEIYKYIHDMSRMMVAADLILSRAGASTLSELSFLGKPAILVPSPNVTDNHQERNARLIERKGGACVLLEQEFNAGELLERILELKNDPERLSQMSGEIRKLSRTDSVSRIADVILDLIADKEL